MKSFKFNHKFELHFPQENFFAKRIISHKPSTLPKILNIPKLILIRRRHRQTFARHVHMISSQNVCLKRFFLCWNGKNMLLKSFFHSFFFYFPFIISWKWNGKFQSKWNDLDTRVVEQPHTLHISKSRVFRNILATTNEV